MRKLANKIWTIFFILVFSILVLVVTYYISHPESHISYYNNDSYYMVNVITGNNGNSPDSWHFGAIKKEDYNAWRDGTATTVWVVSSKNENRGWMLRCNTISTIAIYNKEHLPLNF